MQQKLVLYWRGGTVTVENNKIVIRQGANTILLGDDEERNAFLADVEAAPLPKPIQHPGFGGGMFPPKPNPKGPKSIQQLVDELEMAVQPHR
jgi:hypothetical protein